MASTDLIINELEFERLDQLCSFGERNEALPMSRIEPTPGVTLTTTDRWAIDLGQRAAAYRDPVSEHPRRAPG